MANDYTPIGPVPSGIANGTIDATSRQLARDMRGKAYGKDVRETIARMTEWHSIRSSAAEVLAAQSEANVKKSAQAIDNMVVEFTDYDFDSAPEIVAARRGKPSLGAKIDELDQGKVDKGNVSVHDINKNLGKLDQTYMSDSLLQQIAGNAAVNAVPADGAITPIKTTFFRPINLFDKTKLTLGGFVNGGDVMSNSDYAYSDYIEVEKGYYIVDGNPDSTADFYGSDKSYLSRFSREVIPQPYPDKTIIEVPSGVKLMRVNLFLGTYEGYLKVNPDTFMVVKGNTYPSEYIHYSGKSEKINSKHIDLQDVPLSNFPDNIVRYPVEPESMSIFTIGPFNLFNPQDATVGGFLNNGELVSNPDWGHSDYIEVEYGKKYIKWGIVPARGEFYDVNGDFISNIVAVERDDYTIISPPSGVKSMRVNFFMGTYPDITTTPLERLMIVEGEVYPDEYIEYTDSREPKIDAKYLPSTELPTVSNNVLDGKSFVTAGDSLTHGPGYTPWGKIIADRNGMTYENHGISGSTLSNIDGNNSFVSRWQNMPDNIDYLILWFGWNDQAYAELGLPDSTDTSTFYGALNYILPALRNNYPTTKIGVMVPFLPLAKQEYAEAVKERAKYFGIPLYDFNADYAPLLNQRVDVSPEMIQLARDTWTYDGLHFHQEGHEFLSTVIESFMLSL